MIVDLKLKTLFIKRSTLIILAAVTAAIKLFSLFPDIVEKYYSNGLYRLISATQRFFTGWLPVSFGDLLYGFAGIWLIRQLVLFIKKIAARKAGKVYFRQVAERFIGYVLCIYILFNIFWGLNYNRTGIDEQLDLQALSYSKTDLLEITDQLAGKLNALRPYSVVSRERLRSKKQLFKEAIEAYDTLAAQQTRFGYSPASVKPSIYSYLGNYLGFTGYYNPFSGEAQVNTTIPVFARPFTACHEIGHQLGYAKESEANFAGYLSARVSPDSAFRYSVYFDLYAYAGRYLYMTDSLALKNISQRLSPGVKEDIRELRAFFNRYDTPIERVIDLLYARFLVANEQPSGKMSYNEVVALLIAYYKKTGSI